MTHLPHVSASPHTTLSNIYFSLVKLEEAWREAGRKSRMEGRKAALGEATGGWERCEDEAGGEVWGWGWWGSVWMGLVGKSVWMGLVEKCMDGAGGER